MGQHRSAYLAVEEVGCRMRIADALQQAGWSVVEHATGFHLLQAIADVIADPPGGDHAAGPAPTLPDLLVVDAFARGCAGVTIAAGMRELGVRIPLVLVAREGVAVPISDDAAIRIVASGDAPTVVADLACSGTVPQESVQHSESMCI